LVLKKHNLAPPETAPPTIGIAFEKPLAKVSLVSFTPKVFKTFFRIG